MEVWSVFSGVLTNVEISDMGLYYVPRLLFLFGFEMGMMLVTFNICDMMLVLRASVLSCVR